MMDCQISLVYGKFIMHISICIDQKATGDKHDNEPVLIIARNLFQYGFRSSKLYSENVWYREPKHHKRIVSSYLLYGKKMQSYARHKSDILGGFRC